MQVQSTTQTNAGIISGTASAKAGSESSDFMLMLMAQLRNQNPLDPMQDKDMMAQVAQLNSLEELKSIKELLQTNSSAGQSAYAVSLIGKNVTAALSSGDTVTGVVTGASLTGSRMMLQIGEQSVPVSSVMQVTEAAG